MPSRKVQWAWNSVQLRKRPQVKDYTVPLRWRKEDPWAEVIRKYFNEAKIEHH